MSDKPYIFVFSKIAWDFGLLPTEFVRLVKTRFGPSQEIEIRKELEVRPTTLYLMQHIPGGCTADCAFCVQSMSSKRQNKSSYLVANQMIRFPLRTIVEFVTQKGSLFKRICIQTIFSEHSFPNLTRVITELKKATNVPISADCIPYNEVQIKRLYTIGLDRITINYELATPKLFSKIRGRERNGPYRWEDVTRSLANALRTFGPCRVVSHLLVGIGETDLEALSHVQNLNDQRIVPSMLAFRPLRNTDLESIERISYPRYHALQTAAYLVKNQINNLCNMQFNKSGKLINFGLPKDLLLDIVRTGNPFVTHGCPGCNRPYYTIDPGQRHYTYPRLPTAEEIRMIENELSLYCSVHA